MFYKTQKQKFETAKKLRDIMVPVNTYIKHVRKIETCKYFTPEIVKDSEDVYVMDYIYDNPLQRIIKNHHTYDDLPDTVINLWVSNIAARCIYHLQHPFSIKTIKTIDKSPNIGVMVHKMMGAVIPFDYSKLESLKYVTMPCNYYGVGATNVSQCLVLSYTFDFGENIQDEYNVKENSVTVNPFPIDEHERDNLVLYIDNAIKNKSKLIILP